MGEDDWDILAGMGSGAEKGLQAAGIRNYMEATDACQQLASHTAASGAKYDLDDLICFLCLSQHKEAEAEENLPLAAPAVTVQGDLDSEAPEKVVSASHRAASGSELVPRMRITQKSRVPLPSASAVAPVWKYSCNRILREVVHWLPLTTARSICRCCRDFHGGGLIMASRVATDKRAVAMSMESLVFSKASVLMTAGLPRGQLLRVLACAWELLEKCLTLLLDASACLPLVLLRLSVKLEVNVEHQDTAFEILEAAVEKEALHSLECRVVSTLWSQGEPRVPFLSSASDKKSAEQLQAFSLGESMADASLLHWGSGLSSIN